jgi:hypothetical protein
MERVKTLQDIMELTELSDYACPWSLLWGAPGRSWAVNDTPEISGVKHRNVEIDLKGGDNEKSI